jgi:hypothetical protein
MFWGDDERDSRRTLGIRDKQILYRNAKSRCENPACGKKIDFDEMQVGHKTSWARGGSTTLKNSVCICYRCNKLQGTDSWAVFLKKQNIVINDPVVEMKESLNKMKLDELKALAKKNGVTVKGRIEEGFFSDKVLAPTKAQYVNKLAKVLTPKDLKAPAKSNTPTTKKKAFRKA